MAAQQAIAPINPFPRPDFAPYGLLNVNASGVLPVIFTVVLIIWIIYSLIVTYHWVRYGHRSFLALPLLVIHVMVSGLLILLASLALR